MTEPVGQIDHELADLQLRAAADVDRPAQQRAQPGQQFVGAERLGDVVVRAGVERSDLLALVAHGRQDQDRQPAPAPHLLADLDSAPVGEDEVEHERVGRAGHELDERVGLGLGRLDRVAGAPQQDLQSPDDLRLVIYDEHAGGGGAHCTRPWTGVLRVRRLRRDREADGERGADVPRRLEDDPAAVGLDEAAADREPEAETRRRPRRGPEERLEHLRAVAARDPAARGRRRAPRRARSWRRR